MKLTIAALSVKHLYGRNLVTCVLRNEEGQQVTAELPLSGALAEVKKFGHEVTNAQEVLECIVTQYGFAA